MEDYCILNLNKKENNNNKRNIIVMIYTSYLYTNSNTRLSRITLLDRTSELTMGRLLLYTIYMANGHTRGTSQRYRFQKLSNLVLYTETSIPSRMMYDE